MISAFILLFSLLKIENKVERYIDAIVLWTLYCFSITEILSVIYGINTVNIWISWISFDVVLALFNYLKHKNTLKNRCLILSVCGGGYNWFARKEIIFGIFAIGIMGIALKTIPYNWDSMTYHLPRVFHWLENGTVGHYATHNDRQVASPVLGSFINLHIYAMLNANDILINLLQCISFLTNGVFIYFIAKKICCSKKYCVIAAILYYSMPIAFAEAFTTQNDNYAALWMLCFAYNILDFLDLKEKLLFNKITSFRIFILSLCCGFGYLAKPTIGIGMFIFMLWLVIITIARKDNIKTITIYIFMAGLIILIILAPEFFRNMVTFGALSSPKTGQRQLIGSLHLKHILVNTVKNLTFNMPTVWIYNSTEIIWKYVMRLARVLDIDINNPAISENGREFQVHDAQNYGHDSAINPVIVWLMILCIICFFLKNRKKSLKEIKNQYFIAACVSFLVFCAVLRWEPFVSRYMISYLAILCPAVSGQLEIFFHSKKESIYKREMKFVTVLYFLCITELVGMAYYHVRITFEQSNDNGYFTNRRMIADSYKEAVDFINVKGYKNIGLITGGDSYEYPLEVMLHDYDYIKHINVTNITGKYEDLNYKPDIIITLDYDVEQSNIYCHGYEYEVAEEFGGEICLLKMKKEKRIDAE